MTTNNGAGGLVDSKELRGFAGENARKSHCIHGHPLSGENLYVTAGGWRRCRACNADHNRKSKKKNASLTYQSWRSMRERCNNPNGRSYDIYGGRGISVHPSWEKFKQFLADMGERPAGTTIERIDVNGNYEPSNCRWATDSEQVHNRRVKSPTGHKGIRPREGGRFEWCVKRAGKSLRGSSHSLDQAIADHAAACEKLYGIPTPCNASKEQTP